MLLYIVDVIESILQSTLYPNIASSLGPFPVSVLHAVCNSKEGVNLERGYPTFPEKLELQIIINSLISTLPQEWIISMHYSD